MDKSKRNTAAGLLAILFWSSTVAFSRSLSEPLGPLTAGALNYILGGLLAIAAASRLHGGVGLIFRMPRRYLLVCGALFVSYVVLLYLAVGLSRNRSQVLAVGLANYLWPSLIMVFSIFIRKKRARIWLLLAGILLALAGTWIVVMDGDQKVILDLAGSAGNLLPVGLAAAAAIVWGIYSNLAAEWAPQKGSAIPIFLLASGVLFLVLRFFAGEASRWEWSLAPILVFMVIFPNWLGYLFWDYAMQHGDMLLVTAFSYFTPLLSTLISALVLHLKLSLLLGVGALLISAGAVISRLGIRDD